MTWPVAILVLLALLAGAALGALLTARRLRRAFDRARSLERQAREAERLAYVGRLAGGLIHEIKNPLSTLNLNLELLAEDVAAPASDSERRAARKIAVLREETKRLEDILGKFTLFIGRLELKKAPLDLGALVRDVLDFYEPQAAQHRIALRSSVEDGLPSVEADADLLKQALLNLILNAQAAMPEGGELMVGLRRDGRTVAVAVTDTGSGIPAEELPRVFEAYYSRRRGGTGLGLPIVRRIVSEHGGTIDLASEVGRGTQIVIRLPAATQPVPPQSAAPLSLEGEAGPGKKAEIG